MSHTRHMRFKVDKDDTLQIAKCDEIDGAKDVTLTLWRGETHISSTMMTAAKAKLFLSRGLGFVISCFKEDADPKDLEIRRLQSELYKRVRKIRKQGRELYEARTRYHMIRRRLVKTHEALLAANRD